jgi:uncharacterized protein YuzE
LCGEAITKGDIFDDDLLVQVFGAVSVVGIEIYSVERQVASSKIHLYRPTGSGSMGDR